MATTAEQSRPDGAGEALGVAVRDGGSGAHPYVARLAAPGAPSADLADAAHFLTMLHGRYPGVMDHAADRVFHAQAREWMFRAAAGFAAERAFLTRLVVAAGPIPSTLGQAQSETAVIGQTHALTVLAQSERRGTALGAAFALTLDWTPLRGVLDAAALRFGLTPPPRDLPALEETVALADTIADSPGVLRAIGFGTQQLLLQHRGLWDLLETRTAARREG
jgi:hypothetical protein